MAFPSWRSVATCVAKWNVDAVATQSADHRRHAPMRITGRRAATNCCAPPVRTAPPAPRHPNNCSTVSPLGHLPHLRGENWVGYFSHPGQRTAARADPRHSRTSRSAGRPWRATSSSASTPPARAQAGSGRLPQQANSFGWIVESTRSTRNRYRSSAPLSAAFAHTLVFARSNRAAR